MSTRAKISPAFEPFMEDTGTNDKRDAIVVYASAPPEGPIVRGRLRKLKTRLDHVKARAAAQEPIHKKVVRGYRREGRKRMTKKVDLDASDIGGGALPVARIEVTRKSLPALAKQPDVVAIMPNQRIRLIGPKKIDYKELRKQEVNDKVTWGLKSLGIPDVWATTKTKGKHISIAVLDTGVHGDHPALAGRVKDFIVVDPLGRRIKPDRTFDAGQHGTHVCGTIAGGTTDEGVAIGVAPEADLFAAGVLVGDATLQTLFEGMAWAAFQGVDIINMSLGFTYYEPLFDEFLKLLIESFGILPVVAIGNENHGNTSSPGSSPNAFSVGAVEKMRGTKVDVTFFSSGASLSFPKGTPDLIVKPEIVAPGRQVYSSIPPRKLQTGVFQYTYMDGTSMATPHMSGVVALLMAAKPKAQLVDIVGALKDTAHHPDGDAARPDNRWGFGMVRPADALAAL